VGICLYPVNRTRDSGKTIRVQGKPTESIGLLNFGGTIAIDFNAAAATVINNQAKRHQTRKPREPSIPKQQEPRIGWKREPNTWLVIDKQHVDARAFLNFQKYVPR